MDAFHIFACNRTVDDLLDIPMEKIFLGQFSKLAVVPTQAELIETTRHKRLLQGQGTFPLNTLFDYLASRGYHRPIGLEVFNDALHQQPPVEVAKQAMSALQNCLSGPPQGTTTS
ncbi:hypothetical protein LU604_13775 [Erwinia tracheiphila]|uniref:hypothetical protein n=1 Tax=Erwinia tracheiphila TaxID=65700 RepID=UPI001F3E56D2|nr:hypothetical protein [Erwinia tracheiphila]UIA85703.1 hypothetical protein LU604_13775 [Erwinia tracheiphila]UIA94231.1 hypothetical protein LU632_13340 [Erwinia tracheiphila]